MTARSSRSRRSPGAPSGGALATAASIAAGMITGFVVHEWGQLAGALTSGSTVHSPGRLAAPLLFHFDTARNGRSQFLRMSYRGFAASAIVLAVLVNPTTRCIAPPSPAR